MFVFTGFIDKHEGLGGDIAAIFQPLRASAGDIRAVGEQMRSSQSSYRDWTHERIQRDAAAIGDDAAALVEIILRSRPHPEQGFRSCIGILGLRKQYGVERLEAACGRALALGTRSYSSVAAILKNKQESKTAHERQTDQP